MTAPTEITERVTAADSLPKLLDAACDAFEAVLEVIGLNDDPQSTLFVPMVSAGSWAARGRDQLLHAPSMPPGLLYPSQPITAEGIDSAREAADWIAAVCRPLVTRLAAAAVNAPDADDRQACREAGQCAETIGALMRAESS